MISIADNLENVRQRIKKASEKTLLSSFHEQPFPVQLLPVSKTQKAEVLLEAIEAGLHAFGENYLSEALDKQEVLRALLEEQAFDALTWHFIGPVQSNKTRRIAEHFDWVQSLDRLKIARRLNEQRPLELGPLQVCIQVNIDNEDSKAGILLAELDEFARSLEELDRISLRGLMAIPDPNQSEDSLIERFQEMQRAFEALRARYSSCDTLSMGMSNDLERAIACGSTMVRVGTALFGPRKPKQDNET